MPVETLLCGSREEQKTLRLRRAARIVLAADLIVWAVRRKIVKNT